MPSRADDTRWTATLIVVLTAAAAVLSTSMGLRQSLGLFMEPMVQGASVSVAAFGLSMAIQNLTWGIGQPVMGAIADKHGTRAVGMAAALAFAAGLALMALGGTAGLYLGGGLLLGLAVAGTSHGVLVGAVSRVADPGVRATAVSILAAAGSIGTFIIAPLGESLIFRIGWQSALFVFAAIGFSITAMAYFLVWNRDGKTDAAERAQKEKPDASAAVREALAHPGYLAMTIAFFACGFQLIFIATHLPKYLSVCGLSPTVGAQALALIGLGNAVGTLVIGKLGERFGNRLMLSLVYVMRTVAIIVYISLPVSVESTLLFATAMGFLWLSVIPLVSGLIGGLFGLTNFGALFGVMFLSHQIGAFLGAWLGGLSFDWSGSYLIAWTSLIAVGSLAALIQLLMDDQPRMRVAAAA
jgi:predicted MFS family arabinose efflux permease